MGKGMRNRDRPRWERMQDDWWIAANYGEAVREHLQGWFFYPLYDDHLKIGPFPHEDGVFRYAAENAKSIRRKVRRKGRIGMPTTERGSEDGARTSETRTYQHTPLNYDDDLTGWNYGQARTGAYEDSKKGGGLHDHSWEPEPGVFVVGDAHGNWSAIRGLLIKSGAVQVDESSGLLYPVLGTVLVQIGDLINATKDSFDRDIECLENADIFDILIVGNHEHPYFGEGCPQFSGFKHNDDVKEQMRRLSRKYAAAYQYQGVLVTHAGLVRDYESRYESADDAESSLNQQFFDDPADTIFSRIGQRRGGESKYGGILWSDWQEPKTRTFTQLVGHTPGLKVRTRPFTKYTTEAVCIDLGAKITGKPIAGMWIKKDGSLEVVTYDPKKDTEPRKELTSGEEKKEDSAEATT